MSWVSLFSSLEEGLASETGRWMCFSISSSTKQRGEQIYQIIQCLQNVPGTVCAQYFLHGTSDVILTTIGSKNLINLLMVTRTRRQILMQACYCPSGTAAWVSTGPAPWITPFSLPLVCTSQWVRSSKGKEVNMVDVNMVKVMNNTEILRNHHRPEMTREAWQLSAVWCAGTLDHREL